MLSASSRALLHRTLYRLSRLAEAPRSVRWSLDVDPYDTF
jgi:primosomal protein N'